jgi:ParB-like nuclease family protein
MAHKKLEDHPIAAVFPLLLKKELAELAKDIEENGLLNPILLYETKILDGRNRYRAILTIPKMAEDLDPDENSKGYFDQYEGNDPVGHVISLNCHRRHLTESQRAAIAAELAKLKHGQRADSSIELSEPITQEQAAKLLNVSKSSVKRAKTVKEADPELHSKEGSQIQLPSIKDAASAYKSRCANLRTYPSHSRKSCKAPKC